MSDTEPEVLFTPLEVAAECNISRRRIYDWIAAGWLRSKRVGGRWVVSGEDLDFFREHCRGAEGRLMPQLWEWDDVWQDQPTHIHNWKVPISKRKPKTKKKKPAN